VNRVLREPLLAFFLLGGVIFAVFQFVPGDSLPEQAEIVVTEGHILVLSKGFEKIWQRSPSDEELDGLIQNHVREEVLYREALAMGLDREDPIIKRRLRQKIEFLTEDIADLEKPSEQELLDYLAEHQDDYWLPARYDMRHVFFNVSTRGRAASGEAQTLLIALRANDTDITNLGDQLMVPKRFKNESETDIARALGADFSNALRQLPIGVWQGPVRSGFGIHLVHIDKRIDGRAARISEVRELVLRDWTLQRRKQVNEAFYETLRSRYVVIVEEPRAASADELTMSGAGN